MKRFYRPVGFAIGLIATAAFAWYASRALQGQDLSRFASARSISALVIGGLCYATVIPVSAAAWRWLLLDLRSPRSWRDLAEIMAITQLAKYIPGNVGFHLGRAGMAVARGVSTRAVVSSMLFETVLAVAAALAVGVAGIALSEAGTSVVRSNSDLRGGLTTAAVLLAVLAVLAIGFRLFLGSLRQRFMAHHDWPSVPTLVRAFAAYSTNYIFIGIGIWLMAKLLLPDENHDPGLLAASFALAWVAGFFTPGAPAGLGIREALMLVVLRAAYASPDALVLVVAMRLATVLGDILIFFVGYMSMASSRSRTSTV
ncbi:MAG TPA: lysylphosphatidylglycerol synthase domain-containing protein [Lysobacter sp.]|nr:lysylphosphatidylglycerol synthase domain-containing protein [Lysobacter sp.]